VGFSQRLNVSNVSDSLIAAVNSFQCGTNSPVLQCSLNVVMLCLFRFDNYKVK